MKERIHSVDNLKMLAITCVVIGHIAPLFHVNWLINIIYSFHMALFFTLSTYLLSIQNSTIHIKHKAKQLIIPYISICFLSLIFKTFSPEAIKGYFISETRWGYWFLPTLFILYVLLYLTLSAAKNKKLFWFISIFIFIVLFLLRKYLPNIIIDFFCIRHLLTYWPFFILGYIFNKTPQLTNKITMAFSLCIWLIVLFFVFKYNYSNETTRMIGRFFSVIFFINMFKSYVNIDIPYITIIGKSSLTIYLFHYYFLALLKNSGIKIVYNDYINLCLTLLSSIFIITFCVLIQSKILIRYSITRLLFLGKYKK